MSMWAMSNGVWLGLEGEDMSRRGFHDLLLGWGPSSHPPSVSLEFMLN